MMFGGKCAYCGIVLPEKGWHADHVKAIWRDAKWIPGVYTDRIQVPGRYVSNGKCQRPENECVENIFPACAPCNIDKGAESLEDWRGWLQDRMIESMRKHIPNFRRAERFGRISIACEPLVFWFEKFSQPPTGEGE